MEQVVIVAKTRMRNGVCISGLELSSNKGIRLVPQDRQNYPIDTHIEVGQIWNIEYQKVVEVKPPHTEDVIVQHKQYLGAVLNLCEILIQRIHPWQGGPKCLFNRMLTFQGKKAYISSEGKIPEYSTGYWLIDRPLTLVHDENNKPFYSVSYGSLSNKMVEANKLLIPYVGTSLPVNPLPPDTLVRVSLARWFPPPLYDKCYLQISGWYE